MNEGLKGKTIVTFAIGLVVGCISTYCIMHGFSSGNNQSAEEEMLLENVNGNWIEENGAKYYLDSKGNKLTGEQLIDNLVYCFDDNGVWNGEKPTPVAIISVQQSGEQVAYISLTGGKTWLGDETPEFYMTIEQTSYPKDIGEITVTIHNNSDKRLLTGEGFRLLVWNGKEWIPSAADGLFHNDEGYYVQPGEMLEMICDFQNKPLEAGRYKLMKEVHRPDDKSINLNFAVEFIIKL